MMMRLLSEQEQSSPKNQITPLKRGQRSPELSEASDRDNGQLEHTSTGTI
jgi:hypothetical protein